MVSARLLVALLLLQLPTPAGRRPLDVTMWGYWTGRVTLAGEVHDVTLHFSPREKAILTLARHKLDGLYPLRGSDVRFTPTTLEAKFVRPVPFAISGTLGRDRHSLNVAIVEKGVRQTAVFTRADAPGAMKRPQTPRPPFPYDTFDDGIDTGSGVLAATLTMPRGKGPFPGVVLLSGTGSNDRDGTFSGHRPFAVIADHLTRRGFAVLRFDDRGSGRSSGLEELRTPEADAFDAIAALRYLRAYPRIDQRRTGFIGHSEGGIVAPMAAGQTDGVACMVLLGAPAVDMIAISLAQHEAISRTRGASEALIAFERRVRTRVYDIIRAEQDGARAREAIAAVLRDATREAGTAELPWLIEFKGAIEVLVTQSFSTAFRQRLLADPAPALRAVRVPVLALYGSLDVQVPAEPNAARMREVLGESPSRSDVRVLEGLNHAFQRAKTGAVEEYWQIEDTFAPAALDAMSAWLTVYCHR